MNYLLIHGSWHGAWCWKKLTPLLESKGHVVQCLELPGSGEDAKNAPSVTFSDLYASTFSAIQHAKAPLVVVAHSFAGLLASRACEELHDQIQQVYYIAAWLPRDGQSLVDMAMSYNNSRLPTIFIGGDDPRLRAVDPQRAKDIFYNDCSDEDKQWASERLRPKAVQPDNEKLRFVKPVRTLAKSTYILCTNDQTVNPISQRDIAERFGFAPNQIKTINTGHSPFLSQPSELAKLVS